jgi:hypothetical protein
MGFWRRFWIEYCWNLKVQSEEGRRDFGLFCEFYTAVSIGKLGRVQVGIFRSFWNESCWFYRYVLESAGGILA